MTYPTAEAGRWAFELPSPLGTTRAAFVVTDDELRFESDAAVAGGPQAVRWSAAGKGATAAMPLLGKTPVDMPNWMPGRLEWLIVSRTDGGRQFMAALPPTSERDAIVSRVRDRLGGRWIGERLPLEEANRRLGIRTGGDTLKVVGMVIGVLAIVFLLLIVGGLVAALLYLPAIFVFGAWLFRKGLVGLRDTVTVRNTPTAKAASAAMGLVELEGNARTRFPSPAGVTGRPSVWWDVRLEAWYEGSDRKGGRWKQIAARHGGSIDVVELEDDTGRVPIWLADADLLLDDETWESGKHSLPPGGEKLLAEMGHTWGAARLRMRESRLEADAPMYVLGTLDERHRLPTGEQPGTLQRWKDLLRTGDWKSEVVRPLPASVRPLFAVAIAFLDMFVQLGRGGERVQRAQRTPPPSIDGAGVVVWKGRGGHAFLVSNRREMQALSHLRKRSLFALGFGGLVLLYGLSELLDAFGVK